MERVLAVRKRWVVARDRSQVGPDRTKRRSNRASRSTDGSQHHVLQAPVARAVFLVLLLLNQRGVRVAKVTMTHAEGETPEDVIVLTGEHNGLDWKVVATWGPRSDPVEGRELMTMLHGFEGTKRVIGSGFGGPALYPGQEPSTCGVAANTDTCAMGRRGRGRFAEDPQASEPPAARICSLRMSPCPACRASSSIMCM
jgi:hypothetical protein